MQSLLSLALLLAAPLFQDDTDRRVDQLRKKLKLSDEQTEKVKEIYKTTREAQDRVEAEKKDKVRELLDDDQKKAYDELAKSGMNRGWGRGGDAEEMKKAMDEARKQMDELKEKGFEGFDGGGEGFKVMKIGPEGAIEKKKSPEERVKEAMGALKIEDAAEADVVKGLIAAVAEAQKAIEEHDRDQKKTVDEMLKNKELSDTDIETKLMDLRTRRKEKNTAVTEAQKKLSEVVSYRQELELIKRGILK